MITKLQTRFSRQDFKERINHPKDKIKNGHPKEKKIQIVLEGQSSGISIYDLCLREGISELIFNKWSQELLIEQGHYLQPLEICHRRKKYSLDEKFKVVIGRSSNGRSVPETCRLEGISHDTYLKWSREYLKLECDVKSGLSEVRNKELVVRASSQKVFEYLESFYDFNSDDLQINLRSDRFKLDCERKKSNIICFEKINNIININDYFQKVNSSLSQGDYFSGCMETFTARNNRLGISKVPVVGKVYSSFEFLFKRVLPKLSLFSNIYLKLSKGKNQLLSKAEVLGRLVYCGFEIVDYKAIDGLLYFVVKKIGNPSNDIGVSYGPIFKMSRIGKNGKLIGVYKFRTMHPYSEYLQDYIIRANGYAETGKPANDFRIPKWGKYFRRFWIDEVPQLLNVVKGEMKLVGVRPVSKRYFQDIPKEMQKLRFTQKPGCIPPYVALNHDSNVLSVLQSEKIYLERKIKNPYFTDVQYFFSALINIIFRHKRSA